MYYSLDFNYVGDDAAMKMAEALLLNTNLISLL